MFLIRGASNRRAILALALTYVQVSPPHATLRLCLLLLKKSGDVGVVIAKPLVLDVPLLLVVMRVIAAIAAIVDHPSLRLTLEVDLCQAEGEGGG